jgi:hypothetical protein
MHTPKSAFEYHEPKETKVDASLGYEDSDVRVSGVVVFLTALGIFVAVTAVLCVGIGKVINHELAKADGPTTKWNHPVDVTKLGNLASSPELQHQFAQLASRFPSPRLQTDDGYQEITDIHAKEDLLLENYSWVDEGKGIVRIPIDRAMELVAERGLPVAPGENAVPLLAEDSVPVVKAPLTDGFARTGYEQDQAAKAEALKSKE